MISVGLKGAAEAVVTENMLASAVGSGEANVFATPMMAALMEKAAAGSIKSELLEGQSSVGIELNITHVSATPLHMAVRAESEVTEVSANGRVISFRVSAFDAAGPIGEGTHKRAVVSLQKFQKKTDEKNFLPTQENER